MPPEGAAIRWTTAEESPSAAEYCLGGTSNDTIFLFGYTFDQPYIVDAIAVAVARRQGR